MINPMRNLSTLLFLLAAAPVGALALDVLIAGSVLVAALAVTPLVVPALIGFRVAVGGTARLAATLGNVLRDRTFWNRQVYLLTRSNTASAARLVVTVSAVAKHVVNICRKLRPPQSDEDHRRVLAVLAYLQA
jgi:uncharacterized membrane protein HdeD (DUF308 family)